MKAFSIFIVVLVLRPIAGRADTRADFLRLIERPRVKANASVQAEKDGEVRFTYMSAADRVVPGVMVLPKGEGKHAVIIALHGTGGRKEGMLPFLHQVAEKGFLGVAIDGPYHGERSKAGKGTADYEEAILATYKAGPAAKNHPFYFDTVWDIMRLIDYLQTRADVDGGRIGMYGISKGGIETYLTAAVDTRVAAAVPCIGLESFQWAEEHDAWRPRTGTIPRAFEAAAKEAGVEKPDGAFVKQFYARVAPGIDGEFDGPAMVKWIAPRPVMAINGELDARNPLPALQLCTDAAREAYGTEFSEKFVVYIEEKTGHKVNKDAEEAAIGFLMKWLMK